MRYLTGGLMAVLLAGAVSAQPAPEPPIEDTRLSVHTLVREDVFAGFLNDDAARMARGEANVRKLLASRPDDRAALLAWQGGADLYRAVRARETGKAAEYRRLLAEADRSWTEAEALNSPDPGTAATMAGSILLFGDRLAPQDRPAAWERAYRGYSALYAQQGGILDKLPPHHRGEVMAGLVQSAQRSGRQAEATAALERMLALVKGTPYEATALQWKQDPASAARSNLTCKQCHDQGRLAPIMAGVGKAGPQQIKLN
jgi:hypothetical protein